MSQSTDPLVKKIAFSMARGLNGATARELLDRIGSVEAFFSLSHNDLTSLTGHNADIYIDSYRQALLNAAERDAEFCHEKHINATFFTDPDYPQRLSLCEDAPLMLYRYGGCDLSSAHTVGIVGTRNATQYGIDFTEHLVATLADKISSLVIVSGLAYGVDVAAHKASLSHGVPTVGVLAHDLNQIYPAAHREVAAKMASQGGALVTEYALGTRPHKNHFLARNRIVAGLSDCLVVVESDYRGGSMSTARIASHYGREVFALPGRLTDRYSHGTNRLIANNTAQLLTSAEHLIEHMGWDCKSDAPPAAPTLFRPLSAEEQELVDYITEHPDLTVNDICVRLGKSYATVSDTLFQLEMDDIIRTLPGGRFAPTDKF